MKVTEISDCSLYPLGSKWKRDGCKSAYILKRTAPLGFCSPYTKDTNSVAFIRCNDGMLVYRNCTWIKNPNNITDKEFAKIAGTDRWTRVEDTPSASPPESVVDILTENNTLKSPLCVKCQANPLRRNCECLGSMPIQLSKKSKPEPTLRQGWDNITQNYRCCYLHIDSGTIVRRKGLKSQSWSWQGAYSSTTGERKYLFSNPNTNDVSELMQKVEIYLKKNPWTH